MSHRLSDINELSRTAICSNCGPVKIKSHRKDYPKLENRYRCVIKAKEYKRRYTLSKGSVCEKYGFVPVHSCQLDVDHIDGNHKNNSILNLQTLCANCHRLKTYHQKFT